MKAPAEFEFVLGDAGGVDRQLKGRATAGPNGLELRFEGYGDHSSPAGHGAPVFIELHDGALKVHVWADINKEDPTHSIDLDGARETARSDDEECPECRARNGTVQSTPCGSLCKECLRKHAQECGVCSAEFCAR